MSGSDGTTVGSSESVGRIAGIVGTAGSDGAAGTDGGARVGSVVLGGGAPPPLGALGPEDGGGVDGAEPVPAGFVLLGCGGPEVEPDGLGAVPPAGAGAPASRTVSVATTDSSVNDARAWS